MSSVGTIVDGPSIFSPRRFTVLAVLVLVGLTAQVFPAFAQAPVPKVTISGLFDNTCGTITAEIQQSC